MQKKSRANFSYRIGQLEEIAVLLIWDKNLGNMTVTNDMENVVADIAAYEGIDPKEHFIIYRDSTGQWDGWDASCQDFFFLRSPQIKNIAASLNFDLSSPQTS